MDYFYLFLIAGSVIVFLILQFDKQQRRKVSTLLKNTSDVQPLFMMQCAGQKLNKINSVLTKGGFNTKASGDVKEKIEHQLKQLTNDYSNGCISIQAYNNRLSELLEMVKV